MTLTQRLVNYLHRIFDRNPQQVIALRMGCDGTGLTWKIRDAVLTTVPVGGTAIPLSIDLDGYTVASLAAYIAEQPGYTVPYMLHILP